MTPTLTGQTLSSAECESTLDLSTSDGWFLTIENDYAFVLPDRPMLRTDAGQEDAIVAVLTDAVGTAIDSFEIGNDGSLSVGVAHGILSVAASEDFEAWSIVGPEEGARRLHSGRRARPLALRRPTKP